MFPVADPPTIKLEVVIVSESSVLRMEESAYLSISIVCLFYRQPLLSRVTPTIIESDRGGSIDQELPPSEQNPHGRADGLIQASILEMCRSSPKSSVKRTSSETYSSLTIGNLYVYNLDDGKSFPQYWSIIWETSSKSPLHSLLIFCHVLT